jgi:hypothetical protein
MRNENKSIYRTIKMHIWSIDGDSFPCPREIELDLTKDLKRTEFGYSGSKQKDSVSLKLTLEFEDAKYIDRCIEVYPNE